MSKDESARLMVIQSRLRVLAARHADDELGELADLVRKIASLKKSNE